MSDLPRTLAIASDHGGLDLKNAVFHHLLEGGYRVEDLGVFTTDSVDYPDYAELVAARVLDGHADAGILVCTTGIGMSITANRHAGIQASLVHDAETAAITREHNASNVLCLAGKSTSVEMAKSIVDAWLKTPFAGGRHARRVSKMNKQAHPLSLLAAADPAVAAIVDAEQHRQQNNIELIASENFTSRAVMAAQGSCLTNKYAEGYPPNVGMVVVKRSIKSSSLPLIVPANFSGPSMRTCSPTRALRQMPLFISVFSSPVTKCWA